MIELGRPRLLDLFCGAGGAGEGYNRSGFNVTGVDIKAQRNYPHKFIKGDAIDYLYEHGVDFDAIHASPPCQSYSIASAYMRNRGKKYPDLVVQVRNLLKEIGKPWVIENVPGAPIRADIKLCGCQFGLDLRRQRWFETSWNEFCLLPSCFHPYPVVSVVGHGTPSWVRKKLGYNPSKEDYNKAMGIDWMTMNELSQAIPPAYTEYVGERLMGEMVK